ncbi:MAG: STAS domain-containing protein [Opitutae bacterium]|nr:STAS domain-containing protein [Opitutae bacterium]
MNIEIDRDTVRVTGLPALDRPTAEAFAEQVSAALPPRPETIEVDLAETGKVDCIGLGALVEVFDQAQRRNRAVTLRVIDPTPPARQLLELTRLHRIFPVVQRKKPEAAG